MKSTNRTIIFLVLLVVLLSANLVFSKVPPPLQNELWLKHLAVLFDPNQITVTNTIDWVDMPGMSAQINVGGNGNACVTAFLQVFNEAGSDAEVRALLDNTAMNGVEELLLGFQSDVAVQHRDFAICNVSTGIHQIKIQLRTTGNQELQFRSRMLIVLGP